MLSPESCALIAVPPSLHRQGLLATLHEVWPALVLTIIPDAYQVAALLRQRPFDVVVLDSALAGPPLPELLRQLSSIRPRQHILVLTGSRLARAERHALCQSGAPTLLPRLATPHDVVSTITPWLAGASGGALPACTLPTKPQSPPTPLSRREQEVLRLVVDDCCNQEIADRLCLSVRTVESHRRALLQKTGARTLVGLVVQAVREGWVTT